LGVVTAHVKYGDQGITIHGSIINIIIKAAKVAAMDQSQLSLLHHTARLKLISIPPISSGKNSSNDEGGKNKTEKLG
jgi:hypothetical protein